MTHLDTTSDLSIRPLRAVLGAEVFGVDLRQPLDDDVVAALRRAWLDHQVLFFRDQDLTPEQQISFASRFGTVDTDLIDNANTRIGIPGVSVIDLEEGRLASDLWHVDDTLRLEPPVGAVLRALRLPDRGGDTLFASMYAAYEALSPSMKQFVEGLSAVHSIEPIARRLAARPDVQLSQEDVPSNVHPVVRVHPETGRKALYVNVAWTTRIVELEPEESDALLRFFFEHVKSPDFQCRFSWEVNSVAFWDNRAVAHYAVADYHGQRTMMRVQLAGDDRPTGPARSMSNSGAAS